MSTAPAGIAYQHSWRPGFDHRLIATGWSYPPDSYEKWGELVHQWTKHDVERYGRAEVEKWYFEVWNEPNLPVYWQGYHDDDVPGPDAAVHVDVRGVKARPGAVATLWRVDGSHANSYAAWSSMGAPLARWLARVIRRPEFRPRLDYHARGKPTRGTP